MKILEAIVTSITLCRRGKNGFRTLLKSDGALEFVTLVKSQSEGELLAVVYAPNRKDGDGDFADADVISKAAHRFLRDHRDIDIEHDGEVLSAEDAYIAESFIVAKGDERFQNWKDYDGKDVGDLTGAWAVKIRLENEALRKAYAAGGWDGVSMFGMAAGERVDLKAASERIADKLSKRVTKQESEMDETKLKSLFESFKAEVVALVKSTVTEAVKPAEGKKVIAEDSAGEVVQFEGDIDNAQDLENFEKALRTSELRQAIKSGKLTAKQVAEMRKALKAVEPSDSEAGIAAEDSDEVRTLKRQLFKAQRISNAPEGKQATGDPEADQSKANYEEGLALAKCVNERRLGNSTELRVLSNKG